MCYPVKINNENGCCVVGKAVNTSQIDMLEHILEFVLETGKEVGVSKAVAKDFFRKTLDEVINIVYEDDQTWKQGQLN